jgi:hypothetical protein
VEDFKFGGTNLTKQNSIKEENHSTLQSGNACCHLVKNLLSSILLHKIVKIKILRTVFLFIVLYGYENWSLTLKQEHMLSVFQSKVLVTGECRELYNEELNGLYTLRI